MICISSSDSHLFSFLDFNSSHIDLHVSAYIFSTKSAFDAATVINLLQSQILLPQIKVLLLLYFLYYFVFHNSLAQGSATRGSRAACGSLASPSGFLEPLKHV